MKYGGPDFPEIAAVYLIEALITAQADPLNREDGEASPPQPHLVVPSSVWRFSLFNGAPDNLAIFV